MADSVALLDVLPPLSHAFYNIRTVTLEEAIGFCGNRVTQSFFSNPSAAVALQSLLDVPVPVTGEQFDRTTGSDILVFVLEHASNTYTFTAISLW